MTVHGKKEEDYLGDLELSREANRKGTFCFFGMKIKEKDYERAGLAMALLLEKGPILTCSTTTLA